MPRKKNAVSGKIYTYTYDNGGNITEKKTYSKSNGAWESTYNYTYGTGGWKDQLTSYRGTDISYDALGNPLSYYNGSSYTLTWEQGRKLASAPKGGTTFEFTYDESGHRISKSGYGETITYVWSGDLLIAEYREYYDTTIYFYDANGSPVGFMYKDFPGYYTGGNFLTFYYEKNLQGDIVGILDSDGNKFVSYSYDAWGNVLEPEYIGSNLWSLHYNMAEQNPFRYRGYYYDRETGFYYLNSRYYDPATGRFLNADGSINANGDIIGYNMYAYCSNNPVMLVDHHGTNADEGTLNLVFSILAQFFPALATAGAGAIAGAAIAVVAVAAGEALIAQTKKTAESVDVAVTVDAPPEPLVYPELAVEEKDDKIDPEPSPVFYGADMYGGNWKIVTGPMSSEETVLWVNTMAAAKVYGKKASWGIYTDNQEDAFAMALLLGNGQLPIPHPGQHGQYDHYHVSDFLLFKRYSHFHVWYGQLN